MTTPADNPDADNAEEPQVHFAFAFQTPFGVFTDPDDLPPDARSLLARNLAAGALPPELHALLAKALKLDETQTETAPADAPTSGPHGPGCTCTHSYRVQIWDILDGAFPNDPHLWQAGEALFMLSAANPRQIGDENRRAALEAAAVHLQRQASLMAPSASPMEQIIAKFREQLGDI